MAKTPLGILIFNAYGRGLIEVVGSGLARAAVWSIWGSWPFDMDESRDHLNKSENRHRRLPDAAADSSIGARSKRGAMKQGQHILVQGKQQGEIRAFCGRRYWETIVLLTKTSSSLIKLANP